MIVNLGHSIEYTNELGQLHREDGHAVEYNNGKKSGGLMENSIEPMDQPENILIRNSGLKMVSITGKTIFLLLNILKDTRLGLWRV